jgi:putative addiction module component (TIGR02574 family)
MPITLDEIVEATKNWPPERVSELVHRLTEDLHASAPEIEADWKSEIDRRIEEIESGKVKGIPAEEVSARIQKILQR